MTIRDFLAIGTLAVLLTQPCGASVKAEAESDAETLRARLAEVEAQFRQDWGGVSAEDLGPPQVEDAENRALLVVRAAEEIEIAGRGPLAGGSLWANLTNDFDLSEVLRNAPQIETDMTRFDKALSILSDVDRLRTSSYKIDYSRIVRDIGVSSLSLIDLGRLLTVRALLAVAQGRYDEAQAGIEQSFAVAESYAEEPLGTLQLLRVHRIRDALGVVRELVRANGLTSGDLARLQRIVEQAAAGEAPKKYLLSEMQFHLSVVEEIRGDYRDEFAEDPEVELAFDEGRLRYIEHTDQWLRYSSVPRHERGRIPRFLSPEVDPESNVGLDVDLAVGLATGLANSNWDKRITRFDLDETRRRLAVVALAVERYAADHGGALPVVLSDLQPKYLDEVPSDPFTGGQFTYERTQDGYRLAASKQALGAWELEHRDPVLEWSRSERVTSHRRP